MTPRWPVVKLGEVLRKSEEWVTIDPNQDYNEVTVRLWGKGVVIRRAAKGSEIVATRRARVRAGQFIVSRIDARNGAIGVVPPELDGAVVSNDFPTFDVSTRHLAPAFLGWMSKTAAFVGRCRAASEGTTNRIRLQEERFLAQEIPLPPLEEQRRIVAKLDAIQQRVTTATETRAQVADAVTDLTTSLHMVASAGRTVRLGDVLELDERQERVQADGEYPQVGIRGFGGGLFPKPAVHGTETTYRVFNRLFEGAVVLSQVKGWEGAIDVCPQKLASYFASPEYRTFSCREHRLHSRYAAAIFKTSWFLGLLATLGRGVGARRERARPEAFLSLEIPLPDYPKQVELLAALSRVPKVQRSGSVAMDELQALMLAILDRAFRGEL